MNFTLTAANSVLTLWIPPIFPVPQTIIGYSADDVFSAEESQSAETQMGVDGIFNAGFVFSPTTMRIMLSADSPSRSIFDTWYDFQRATKDGYFASGVMMLPALGTQWALQRGVLGAFTRFPPVGRILRPRSFNIIFGSMTPSPI